MVKKVIWSLRAQQDKKEILNYWLISNRSNRYSKRLNQLFTEATNLLLKHPELGRQTSVPLIRIKIIKEYLMIYEVSNGIIQILSIWDGRQNPAKLKKILD